MFSKLAAEFLGTFWLVLGGCGSAVLAAAFPGRRHRAARRLARLRPDRADDGLRDRPDLGLPLQPRRLGRALGGRPLPGERRCCRTSSRRWSGGIAGAGVLYLIASGKPGFDLAAASRPTATASTRPAGIRSAPRFVAEVVMTFMFLIVILGRHAPPRARGLRRLAIGLALTLIHLISIPVTNTSVNPARSTGPALFVGGWALQQLWLFWLAPIVGGDPGRRRLPRTDGRRDRRTGGHGPALRKVVAGRPFRILLAPDGHVDER